ncbi:hypothetical protein Q5P01_015738 [Channa striata]|uniref:Cornifelin n=1 Tax=Channa striata TaxID=64152 RepID=A0AA88SDD2_CHASR|nr:hypothetical protein Q5P01_015738 [Channa striata]
MAGQPLKQWNTELCDCCDDASTCCYGFWCLPCLACTVSKEFGENTCLPLCDMLSPAVCTACGIPLFAPPAGLSLRAAMRNRYGIKGSLCKDIVISCFCEWCNWCQMHREFKHRKNNPTAINMQPQQVVNVQQPHMVMVNTNPAPVGFGTPHGVVVTSY